MSNISVDRQGEITLLVLQATEQEQELWLGKFQSRDEVEFALNNGNDCLGRLPIDHRAVAKERLELAIERYKGNAPKQQEAPVGQVVAEGRRVSHDQIGETVTSFRPPTTAYLTDQPTQSVMLILETDKGSFFHMDSWKGRLSRAFKHMDGFDQIFAMACMVAKVDPTISYISEAKKKVINGKLAECSALYIEQLTANL
jgi:hypothetical protein